MNRDGTREGEKSDLRTAGVAAAAPTASAVNRGSRAAWPVGKLRSSAAVTGAVVRRQAGVIDMDEAEDTSDPSAAGVAAAAPSAFAVDPGSRAAWPAGMLNPEVMEAGPSDLADNRGALKRPVAATAPTRPVAKGKGKGLGRRLTPEKKSLAAQMLEDGASQTTVAKEFGVSKQAISKLSKKRHQLAEHEQEMKRGIRLKNVRGISNDDKDFAKELHDAGVGQSAIAGALGVSQKTVSRLEVGRNGGRKAAKKKERKARTARRAAEAAEAKKARAARLAAEVAEREARAARREAKEAEAKKAKAARRSAKAKEDTKARVARREARRRGRMEVYTPMHFWGGYCNTTSGCYYGTWKHLHGG